MLSRHIKKSQALFLKGGAVWGYGGDPRKFFDPVFPRFKVITYRKGSYRVVDRYTGDEKYAGQAITFYKKRPIFAFNFYGRIFDKKFTTKQVYGFLKKALRAGAGKSLYRGLNGFREGEWLYQNSYKEKQGFIEGEEKIFFKRTLIYRQVYHGGAIEDTRTHKEWSRGLLSSRKLQKEIRF